MTILARLDARPDRLDLRDREYRPPLVSLAPEYPRPADLQRLLPLYRTSEMVLNQGSEGACTGFGLAACINYLFWRRDLLEGGEDGKFEPGEQPTPKVSTRMLYHLARFYDEWPGENYDGSSCRGAIKAWFKHGVCREDYWPYYHPVTRRAEFVPPTPGWELDASERPLGVYYRIEKSRLRDMQAAIQEVGAIYCSARVHKGWNRPGGSGRDLPLIAWRPNKPQTGGHAFALVGYNRQGFVVQNSWGPGWGRDGFAVLSYSDWLDNGSDAWVCVLGAPTNAPIPNFYYTSDNSAVDLWDSNGAGKAGSAGGGAKAGQTAARWGLGRAYQHTVVMGNDGRVINRLVDHQDGETVVKHLAHQRPLDWFRARDIAPRIMLYAHGGLNDEADSLKRIRCMAPYFEANGVYPLFFTWKTGVLESLLGIVEDSARRFFPWSAGIDDFIEAAKQRGAGALDRGLEVACENLGVKALWSQMKQNAGEAGNKSNGDRGGWLTLMALAELKNTVPELEIHLVGHSAGSILLGHLLDHFPGLGLKAASCSLYAPACTLDFANGHYIKAVTKGALPMESFHLHLLSEALELDDTVGPYQKSLLYLISRALEPWHKTPILGMEMAYDPDTAKRGRQYDTWHPDTLSSVRRWQKFWGERPRQLISTDQVPTRGVWKRGVLKEVLHSIDAAHGGFDNDIQTVTATLGHILGSRVFKLPVNDLKY